MITVSLDQAVLSKLIAWTLAVISSNVAESQQTSLQSNWQAPRASSNHRELLHRFSVDYCVASISAALNLASLFTLDTYLSCFVSVCVGSIFMYHRDVERWMNFTMVQVYLNRPSEAPSVHVYVPVHVLTVLYMYNDFPFPVFVTVQLYFLKWFKKYICH